MKKLLILIFIFSCYNGFTQQVTDDDIAKSLLNKSEMKISQTLDSLGVWYKFHRQKTFQDKQEFVFSIENSNKSVKVYVLKSEFDSKSKLEEKYMQRKIKYVIVNYRHDDKVQVEALMELKDTWKITIGKYSTDVFYMAE
jgi:hypothetical protein